MKYIILFIFPMTTPRLDGGQPAQRDADDRSLGLTEQYQNLRHVLKRYFRRSDGLPSNSIWTLDREASG
uniref:Conotoxin unclassified superfamily n=1 Tax=Conus monile TaxID=351660 RepID=A0A9Y1Z3C0_CONMO|nr:conotoxin precursor unclassified superfamily [Conus monile]